MLSLQLPPDYKNEMLYSRSEMQMKRSSRASDTSSAYSGSDMMQSSIDDQENQDMDLTGMQEGYVDSDEEEDKLSNTEVDDDTYTALTLNITGIRVVQNR